MRVPRVQQLQWFDDVRVPVTAVGASSNRGCVTCPIVATVNDVRVPIVDVGTSSNRVCATCPTAAMVR
jgi:hypothetical protein